MKPIELNDDQYELLTGMSFLENPIIAMFHPIESDKTKRKMQMKINIKNVSQLIKAGLLKDVSKDHKAEIEHFRKGTSDEEKARKIRIIAMTNLAAMMFRGQEGRPVN